MDITYRANCLASWGYTRWHNQADTTASPSHCHPPSHSKCLQLSILQPFLISITLKFGMITLQIKSKDKRLNLHGWMDSMQHSRVSNKRPWTLNYFSEIFHPGRPYQSLDIFQILGIIPSKTKKNCIKIRKNIPRIFIFAV